MTPPSSAGSPQRSSLELRVRPYIPADHAEWLRMSMALFPGSTPDDHARDFATFLSRTDTAVFVVERAGAGLAGFIEAGARPYVDGCDTSPVGYIEAWYVDADARLAGWGRALLEAAESWARSRGYTEMGSDALIENDVSHHAHLRSGYEEVDRVVQYRKRL